MKFLWEIGIILSSRMINTYITLLSYYTYVYWKGIYTYGSLTVFIYFFYLDVNHKMGVTLSGCVNLDTKTKIKTNIFFCNIE